DEPHGHLGALGGAGDLGVVREIDAGIGLRLRVPPGGDVMPGRIEERAESQLFTGSPHGDVLLTADAEGRAFRILWNALVEQSTISAAPTSPVQGERHQRVHARSSDALCARTIRFAALAARFARQRGAAAAACACLVACPSPWRLRLLRRRSVQRRTASACRGCGATRQPAPCSAALPAPSATPGAAERSYRAGARRAA